eukprot:COSAG02_NODE_3266_length_7057_cov_12.370078_2_plen_69_part_00
MTLLSKRPLPHPEAEQRTREAVWTRGCRRSQRGAIQGSALPELSRNAIHTRCGLRLLLIESLSILCLV